ncbi:hypothetical protein E3J20_07165 [Candidatus Bathyarchaeota archaeon]|jgi:hypothetical protein|nr:MAG: hypothetical protein E3J20_07165 [Candidatus Bathyarchaeota archaeon]
MSENDKGFMSKIFGVITSPRRAFQDIEERDLRTGLLIVLLVAVLSAWAGITYFSKTELNLQAAGQSGIDFETIKSRMMPFIAIGGIVSTFIRWLVPSLLVLLTAKVLVGEGSSRRMLAMTGFAFIPMAAQQLLRVLDAMTISSANLAALAASQLNATGLVGKIFNQAIGVFTVFGLLTVLLSTYAVSANYGADTRKSATATVAAYLIYVLLRAFIPII